MGGQPAGRLAARVAPPSGTLDPRRCVAGALGEAVEQFTLTERGKLDRRALPEPGVLHHRDWEAPLTETEQRLAARWESLLGREPDRTSGFLF